MAIRLVCPSCRKAFKAQDSYLHKKIKCPNCKAKFIAEPIDEDTGTGERTPDAVPGDTRDRKRRIPRKRIDAPRPQGRRRESEQAGEPVDDSGGAVRGEFAPVKPSPAGADEETYEGSEDAGETECPYCREIIKAGARKCRHCGEFLDKGLKRRRAGGDLRARHGRRERAEAEAIRKKGSRALLYAIVGIFICGIVLEPVALILALQAISAAKEKSQYAVPTGSAKAAITIACIILGLYATAILIAVAGR